MRIQLRHQMIWLFIMNVCIRIMMQERLHICEIIFFTITLKKHCNITAKNLLITNVYVMTDKMYYFVTLSASITYNKLHIHYESIYIKILTRYNTEIY